LGFEDRKIAWVKWENLCKPREEGGLGLKHIENIVLLAKWKWRLGMKD